MYEGVVECKFRKGQFLNQIGHSVAKIIGPFILLFVTKGFMRNSLKVK